MNIEIRQAKQEDIIPALELARNVFLECDSSDYGEEHTQRMKEAIQDRMEHLEYYLPGQRLMIVALDDSKVVGIIETYGTNRIALMFVDPKYHRRGIATKLMSRMVSELKLLGHHEVVLNSSPKGLPFYRNFGFLVVEEEKNKNTPWKTPMRYEIR